MQLCSPLVVLIVYHVLIQRKAINFFLEHSGGTLKMSSQEGRIPNEGPREVKLVNETKNMRKK